MKKFLIIPLLIKTSIVFSQSYVLDISNNTNYESEFRYFADLTTALLGYNTLEEVLTKKLHVNGKFNLDSNYLKNIQSQYNSLVGDYFEDYTPSPLIEYPSNSESSQISITNYYIEKDKEGSLKVIFGLKVVFKGTDPKVEKKSPEIIDIQILKPNKITFDTKLVLSKILEAKKELNQLSPPPPPPVISR